MIRILIADDQQMIREGIKTFLEPHTQLKVIGIAKDGQDTIKQVEILQPDILLLDVEMPQGNGIKICHQISFRFPNTKIIFLSSYEEKIYIQQGIKAGAKGYLQKDATSEELSLIIELVNMGYSVFESKILKKLIIKNTEVSSINSTQPDFARLKKSQERTTRAKYLNQPQVSTLLDNSNETFINKAKFRELQFQHNRQLSRNKILNTILISNLFFALIVIIIIVILLLP